MDFDSFDFIFDSIFYRCNLRYELVASMSTSGYLPPSLLSVTLRCAHSVDTSSSTLAELKHRTLHYSTHRPAVERVRAVLAGSVDDELQQRNILLSLDRPIYIVTKHADRVTAGFERGPGRMFEVLKAFKMRRVREAVKRGSEPLCTMRGSNELQKFRCRTFVADLYRPTGWPTRPQTGRTATSAPPKMKGRTGEKK